MAGLILLNDIGQNIQIVCLVRAEVNRAYQGFGDLERVVVIDFIVQRTQWK
jgi:hypothetical protein